MLCCYRHFLISDEYVADLAQEYRLDTQHALEIFAFASHLFSLGALGMCHLNIDQEYHGNHTPNTNSL